MSKNIYSTPNEYRIKTYRKQEHQTASTQVVNWLIKNDGRPYYNKHRDRHLKSA